jgi:hypothetical protein
MMVRSSRTTRALLVSEGVGRILTNDFSWSKSRHEKFAECRRAYYFQYYLSWGGWEAKASASVRQLYILKRLSNRFTWAGSIVHDTIRTALTAQRLGGAAEAGTAIERAHRTMQQDFRGSRQKLYWKSKIRKDFGGLVEHEYDELVPPEAWKQNWHTVKQALEWYFSSRWPGVAGALSPEAWLEVDTTDFERSVFHLEGVKVFAVPDFAFRGLDGTVHIIDWKTGKAREGYDEQVVGYALYLQQRYRLPLDAMRATLVYLNDGVEQTVGVGSAAVESFRRKFADSVQSMRAVLRDPAKNEPQPEECFGQTERLESCARCPFRRPCGREATTPSAGLQADEAAQAR